MATYTRVSALLITSLALSACAPGAIGDAPNGESADAIGWGAQATSWPHRVEEEINTSYLQETLGARLPTRSSVFAARVTPRGARFPGYEYFEARGSSRRAGSSFAHDFAPGSSVKLLGAIGAFEVAHASGLDVNSTVPLYAWETQTTAAPTLAERAYNSITYLDVANRANGDFDRLVEFAGPDYFSDVLLTDERGLTPGYLQWRYQYDPNLPTLHDPSMTLCDEGGCSGWRMDCQANDDAVDCPWDYEPVACRSNGDTSNCTSLFNLAEAIRRTVMHREIPLAERWKMPWSERESLKDYLAAPRYTYSEQGIRRARAEQPVVYHKYGETSTSCVDSVFVEYPESGDRFFYAVEASIPASQCASFLTEMGESIILSLGEAPAGTAIRPGTFTGGSSPF